MKLPITPTEFRSILLSHGWHDLAPFKTDIENRKLIIPFAHADGNGCVEIHADKSECHFNVVAGDPALAQRVVNNALSLDRDMSGLYAVVKGTDFEWLKTQKRGRYLRGTTLFEDCFKIILTTNINWDMTKRIVASTVEKYGTDLGGYKAFPLPASLSGIIYQSSVLTS